MASYNSPRFSLDGINRSGSDHTPLIAHTPELKYSSGSKINDLREWFPFRWLISLLCSLGLVIAYLVRVNLSVTIIPMAKEYNWSKTTQGLILSSFYMGYIALMLFGGWLSTKLGSKWVLGFAIVAPSIMTIVTPWLVEPLPLFIMARVLTGLTESVAFPAVHEFIAQWIPIHERSKCVPFVWNGAQVGTILAFSVTPHVINAWGWESVFWGCGALGIVWGIPWLILSTSKPDNNRFVSAKELAYIKGCNRTKEINDSEDVETTKSIEHTTESKTQRTDIPWLAILTCVHVWAIVVANFCSNWGGYVLLSLLPTYFDKELGFDLGHSGLLSVTPYIIYCFASFGSGAVADLMIKRKWFSVTDMRKILVCFGLLLPACFLIALNFVSTTFAIIFLNCAVGLGGIATPGWGVNHTDISPRLASILMGLSNTFGTIPGAIGVYLSEWILDNTDDNWLIVFAIASGLQVFGCIFYIIFGTGKRVPSLE